MGTERKTTDAKKAAGSPSEDETWSLIVTSEEFGPDLYGPYDSEKDAEEARERIEAKAAELKDGIEREYTIIRES